ncbi:putative DNA-binding transcriptional regulator YafY [Kibdelosporangium banguiense]|uniref:DNA-binding transcriptional regulator YafY n=1 Tax=Kibdelosporangium banguiense TaxID=1365924 RepID=A0ABS4TU74_9PSEU|nr:YafY family protein [Kibdelosporangium banguiense]MBP2327515.1 putative DNA-binding transcriptional regulator YafY [Kibdelosporangium banguiense]
MTTSARLLRLLSLLQSRRDWTGPELAGRLEVTTRTIRNDMDRLRGLGYPVEATPGVQGGYRLGVGASMPPLLLDDDEAVAVAVGLRTAASGMVDGIEETSVRALAKVEQMLPSRLRRRVNAVQTYTVTVPPSGPRVDADVLATIAAACRDHERLRFDYRDHSGTASLRVAEPHRLVNSGRRWYLVAWDVDRADWRTFRVDRVSPRTPTGPRFRPREAPEVADYVTRGATMATWRYTGRVRLLAPLASLEGRLPSVASVESSDEDSCVVLVGSDSPVMLAHHIGLLDVDFEVLGPPELAERVRALAARYARAAGSFDAQWTG